MQRLASKICIEPVGKPLLLAKCPIFVHGWPRQAIRQPRADTYTRFREMKFGKFPLEQGWICSDRVATAPQQISQAPGLREFRLAESQQILPVTGKACK